MWQSSKAYPMAYCPPGTRVHVVLISTTDLTDRTDSCPVAIEEIKKFVAFPWAYALTAR